MKGRVHAVLNAPLVLAAKRPVKDAFWTLKGLAIRETEVPRDARRVLFVCHGNICRSPLAERLARRVFEGRDGFSFLSAGVDARPGSAPPANAVEAALALGIDLNGHQSRAVDNALLLATDLVVGMEPWHLTAIERQFPNLQRPSALLSGFEEPDRPRGGYLRYNVPDPYGRDIRVFVQCFARIESCLRGLRSRIT